jgi:hypothetical protein
VETSDYLRLAQAVPRIMARIDPRSPAADDAKGWAYEGLYFEADDERRVPFLSVSNFLRGPNGAVASSRAASAFIPIRTPDGHSRPGGREAPRRSTRWRGPAELVQELRS